MSADIMNPRIAYLTLQATREGQAAHAHVHEIIAGLTELGWHIDLYEPGYSTDNLPNALRRLVEFSRIHKRLLKNVAEYDVLYIRAHPLAWRAARSAAAARIPVVQESNGPYQDLFTAWPATRPLRPLIKHWQRAQYHAASAIIAISESLAEWLRKEAPGANVTVIPNGANIDLFRPDVPAREGLPDHYVTFFGALARWQGVETILSAVRSDEWPQNVAVVIAGGGAEHATVEAAARRDARVVYLGTIPYREVPGLITGSIAGLSVQGHVPGRPTPSAVKVFEILACGRPCVVTDSSGSGTLIRAHDCGLVIPPDDPAALARAVTRLTSNPDEAAAMGARGRAAVVAAASWKARALATAQVLERTTPR